MPDIGESGSGGITYSTGFWQSQTCDNSLAQFPTTIDSSWGILGLEVDGTDSDNYIEVILVNVTTLEDIKRYRFNSNGKKQIDVSEINNISSEQDLKIRIEITTYI